MAQTLAGIQGRAVEVAFTSDRHYANPMVEAELEGVLAGPSGGELRIPGFWAGGQTWKLRFTPSEAGSYRLKTLSTDVSNRGIHGHELFVEVAPYQGENPLYVHGRLKVAPDGRHFQHSDGTPFFWLGDTWWNGMSRRIRWPEEFALLTRDRVRRGFTVIQVCASFPPIMDAFDSRGENEAGLPWSSTFGSVRPQYFDACDQRIFHLVDSGLMPCVFSGWGYNLLAMGVERMKRHWRYLVARWGCYPVIWCLAGEGSMPWYGSKTRGEDKERLAAGWSEVGRYLREIDPYSTPVTYHPTSLDGSGRKTLDDPGVIDFDMLQTGHWMNDDAGGLPYLIGQLRESLESEPKLPVVNGEPAYEGVFGGAGADYQRLQFWATVLSGGVAGFTYGAAGLWEANRHREQAGVSPDGVVWSTTAWHDAYRLPGSQQLGISADFLKELEWWRLEPHQEWVEPHWAGERHAKPFAAGVPGKLRLIYFLPQRRLPVVCRLEGGVAYEASLFSPVDGSRHLLGRVQADRNGRWQIPKLPVMQDWVLLLQAVA
jgi:hypothetical protein